MISESERVKLHYLEELLDKEIKSYEGNIDRQFNGNRGVDSETQRYSGLSGDVFG
jgi:hypothetical protein